MAHFNNFNKRELMEPSCYNYQMEMWDQIYGNKGVCSYIYIYIYIYMEVLHFFHFI